MKDLNNFEVQILSSEEIENINAGGIFETIGYAIGWIAADLANWADHLAENRASVHGLHRVGEW